MARRPRERKARGASVVGARFEVTVGPVAHGGHCVARVAEAGNRVVFVRHALPGEQVVVEVTEGTEGDGFWRGDAVEVRTPSPDRVPAPCPYAGPELCGGCDFQHVALPAQRDLKAAVVREQLVRLGGLAEDDPLVAGLVVEAVDGDQEGLRWRTRMRYVGLPGGAQGLHVHRSSEVVEIDDCRIAHPRALEVVEGVRDDGPTAPVVEQVAAQGTEREFAVDADGFWQVHPGAPGVLVGTVLELLGPRPGEAVLDLYAGVGVFAAFLADRVGERGRVVAVEGDLAACGHARGNLVGLPQARVAQGSVDRVLRESYDEPFDLVVLDPPREGARRKVVEQVVDRAPRAVAYVACDPAALARDVATFADLGYRLSALRAFDLFPMTHHVECVALLTKTGVDLR
ncbi:class I SAM-dependent RNA methyltransferase [Nocardioides donggukensis]|uniref:Class I SAM-dependent RNA methyltransferase n=1 Tax=Nocardioides donggukensis TaxID=2774019 RepID=A0A927K3B5_9ACTN|nr:TRAM domain-containing protein [Nocardioides donggukensis]MBD8869619.1 class I SAM-dependent RNA methyltransferase [Nocardioides donggukensis]